MRYPVLVEEKYVISSAKATTLMGMSPLGEVIM
jgi:hypothetical protein